MFDFEYYRPENTDELREVFNRTRGRLIAGGTDVLPRLRRGQFVTESLIDISRLSELRFIREVDGQIEIGALTTHANLVASPLLQQQAPALLQAVVTIGCPQTRQRGTLGGNLANASPAADSAPPLLTLAADLYLTGVSSTRIIHLYDFFIGPGDTCLDVGEYIHSVTFCRPSGRWGAAFEKLGKRNGMAISLASAAAYLEIGAEGRLKMVRLALGSVAPRPVRCPHAEAFLVGNNPGHELFQEAGQAALEDISPISDVRASAEYRQHIVPVLIRRTLEEALQQAESRSE
jgi:CO/xanthine dehydrogenase FAD-binding subunit